MTSKSRSDTNLELVGKYLAVMAGGAAPYLIAFLGVKRALPTQPVVALIASLITLAIAIWSAVKLSQFIENAIPTTMAIVALLVASTYASVGAFAGLSATLQTWRPTSYDVTAVQPLLPAAGRANETIPVADPFGVFSNYYLVVMLDLIPGIEFSETLALTTPVQTKSKLGGLLVLGFKIYVLIAVIGAFKKWREMRKQGKHKTTG